MENRISREDFKHVLIGLRTAYSRDNFVPTEQAFNVWYTTLQDIPYPTLQRAALNYIMTNKFPPTIADIRAYVLDMATAFDVLAAQAWDQLLRALRKSYAPESEQVWNELPEVTKMCVGGYATFRAWGNASNESLESVQRPMFMKRFEMYQSRERKELAVPEGLRKKPLPAVENTSEYKAVGTQAEARGERAMPPEDKLAELRRRLGGRKAEDKTEE